MDGATQAEVPLHDYGFKAAYRQSLLRRWLIINGIAGATELSP